ncbi:helix-turn-helix domain-containing protein [Streptomyces sp. CC210A]|uniref:helix-turn-helix domain-containing protein n=1 Tax=Streptomyces sp. CC210A TaxID=2898184 RepID=UPI001F1D4CCF|nr:helix-turn-helix transcriptional regulator [Streptomyces sp. CC210A]
MGAERVGRRIAYWREHRGLTQSDFGRLMGQSRRWVQDLEGGQRQTDPRLSVLQRAAEILRIPLERLVTDPAPTPASTPLPGSVAALVDSLHQPAHRPSAAVHLPDLRRRLAFCCQAWTACHYTAVARDLPAILAAAHVAAADSTEGSVLLSRAYQLTASLLFKYGQLGRTPGVLAADRALVAAESAGDPVAIGAAARRVARGLIHQQRHATAAAYAKTAAAELRPELEQEGSIGLSTLGMLYLVAAVGATGAGRSPSSVAEATERLGEAGEVAQRQGDDQDADYTSFGPTNVRLHEVDVLLRLDDAWSALEAAQRIDPGALAGLGRERQARHLVTSARASALTRRREDATQLLLDAEQLAPEEVRRPSVLGLVRELLILVPNPDLSLRELAQRCGLRP